MVYVVIWDEGAWVEVEGPYYHLIPLGVLVLSEEEGETLVIALEALTSEVPEAEEAWEAVEVAETWMDRQTRTWAEWETWEMDS